MTKEDMIRMAKEAGWQYAHGESGYEPLWEFAALVASAEREEIIKIAKDLYYWDDSESLIKAIQARGSNEKKN